MVQGYDFTRALHAGTPVEQVVEVLKELSNGGRALELGVGSGRIALLLAAAGVTVTGIDASAELLEVLRATPGGAELPVLLGNFRDLQGGPYSLIYALSDTFWHLPNQDDQVACFANASQALVEGGILLIETTLVPCKGETLTVQEASDERVVLRVNRYDRVHQIASSATMVFTGGGEMETFTDRMRCTTPAELDLMARIAGLTFKVRWADWEGNPITARSGCAITLYELRTRNW